MTTVCYGLSQNQLNVLHFRILSITGTQPGLTLMADQLSASYGAQLKNIIPIGTTFNGVKFRQVSPVTTAVIVSTNGAGAGTQVGDALPPQVSGLLTVRAATAPPRTRSRIYLPGATTNATNAFGKPTPGYITLMTTYASFVLADHNIVSGANSCILRPVIWHAGPPGFFYDITSVTPRTSWATQRRRSLVGRNDTPAV